MGKAYSFKKFGHDQIHIFEGYFHIDQSCDAAPESICKRVKLDQGKWYDDHVCLTPEVARLRAAHIGQGVCADCIKRLYRDY
jgi:hypothetical protein